MWSLLLVGVVTHLDAMWVNPEAAPLAEALPKRGLRIGVVTNTVAPLTQAILERAKLSSWFEVRATADLVEHTKPAPDLVRLGLKEAVMICDSRFDREAAGAAGVRFIGLELDGDSRVERLGDLPVELGWSSSWRLRAAGAGDEGAVESLLGRLSLPLDGLRDFFPAGYTVAVDGAGVVGVAGLERYGDHGLLRSVVVESRLQRTGLGTVLVDERLAEARKQGLQSVSLLTTTAREYCLAKGFREAPRDSAAPAVARSIEFTKACPSTAAHLVWRP